ncbi:hypothetical protein H5410_023232 [Solanum commersonii]|uniref:Uncharacterized protein n=1 Tax=Solanum commersonii TaxID=4109 RepID=A0A9J5ZIP0_SOLCO|nr:hypothetical protein H5410_023232 [Solanum commersonii]
MSMKIGAAGNEVHILHEAPPPIWCTVFGHRPRGASSPNLRKILPQQLGFKGECNIGLLESRHVLLRFTLKEDYIAIFSKTSRSIKFAGNVIPFRIQKQLDSLLMWTRPSTARVKVEVDLLRTLPKRIRVQIKNLATDEITNVWQKIRGIENHIEGEKFRGDLRVHLNAKKADSNRLEVGEKDDEGTVKDLQIGAEKSGVQDQNLVHQNSGQCLGKAVLDDYSSGNRMLSLIPQTDEFSRKKNTSPNQQSCNSADRIEVEEQLVRKEKEVAAENSSMRQGDKHTPEKLHDAIQTPKFDVQLENLAVDGHKKFEGSKCGDLQPLEPVDLQVEISVVQSNEPKDIVCTNPFEALEVEKELELVDSSPTNEQTLVRADFDIIQESEAARLLKPNSAIKSPMVTLNTSAHEVSKEKQREMSTPRWADLVDDEEEHVSPPLLNRKLSPQALEFVPKSIIAKKKEQEALASEFSPTRGYESDLGNDSFDEDEEENMLDICFDKVARDGDISPRHQRSGSNKNKKKTHGRQHSWDGKVTGLAKQNHMTVSIASTRSNTSKKK